MKPERASVSAEFVVLMPVYLLCILGLLYLGDMVLVRQQCVEAARYAAWRPNDRGASTAGSLDSRFFEGLSGEVSAAADTEDSSGMYSQSEISDLLRESGKADSEVMEEAELMTSLLNGRGGRWLTRNSASVSFNYDPASASTGGWLFFPRVTVSASHDVVGRTRWERTTAPDTQGARHAIEGLIGVMPRPKRRNQAWETTYDPSVEGMIVVMEEE